MFFRVLSAMVVADAIDRRARGPAKPWPAPPAANGWHSDDRHASRAASRAADVTAAARAWDRRTPERPY